VARATGNFNRAVLNLARVPPDAILSVNDREGNVSMAASVESQERWNQWYQNASKKSGERERVVAMMHRRIWNSVLMVASTLFVAGLTTVFYNVLSR
jgi:hypothetical protein